MKKSIRLVLTVLLAVVLYAAALYFLQGNPVAFGTIVVSLLFAGIGIPVGVLAFWFLRKQNMPENQKNMFTIGLAVIWGFLFGWLSLFGVVIGQYAFEYYAETKGHSP